MKPDKYQWQALADGLAMLEDERDTSAMVTRLGINGLFHKMEGKKVQFVQVPNDPDYLYLVTKFTGSDDPEENGHMILRGDREIWDPLSFSLICVKVVSAMNPKNLSLTWSDLRPKQN